MKIYHKKCSVCKKPIRLFRERISGVCIKCGNDIVNDLIYKIDNPKLMREVKNKCKKKGLSKEETQKEIDKIRKIITK